jgi:fructose/tagatose bisphosphate aldolase
MPEPAAKLLSRANAATVLFLSTEVETGISFARMAARTRSRKKPRPGDAEKIKRYLTHARTAYDVVALHIGTVRGKREELRQINLKFSELKKMLDRT